MSNLPSGTVTFLFTDVEGSTALWERDRQAMRVAVERHLAILRESITAQEGVPFKVVGDAMQAAFPVAPNALVAALTAQTALHAESWPQSLGSLRVRMALHAGEAMPDDRGDYLAAPLNRLSRLLTASSGGQIVLSQTVQQLVRGRLPDHVELRDLGQHRLRDLLEPEHVFQLLHPALPSEFPPLRSLDNRPNNLPLQPTPFLGREREVADVVELLLRPEIRLVTLTGPGGSGKTRLVLQAAADLLDDFPDGAFLVTLAALKDPDLMPSAIAGVLGIREEGERQVVDRLHDALASKHLLIVLDNLEHLIQASPVVGEFLGTSPGLKILATSRVPLRIRAEREYPVPSLGLPPRKPLPPPEQLSQYEAVRLFIDRAQAIKPDFSVDAENAPAIAEICWRLDGLPLAIELAAARVRMLSPQAMLARLGKRLPLLVGGARDAPERQQTLRATIDWSHELLSPEDQILFRRLAAFAGGATLDAIEVVANANAELDVFTGLDRLLEQNLLRQEVQPDGEPRFTMLETIHEFAQEHLEGANEAQAVQRRHAARFLAWAKEANDNLTGPEQIPWLQRLEAEHDNLRAALRTGLEADGEAELSLALTGTLSRFWFIHGHLVEGRGWLDRALEAGGDAPSEVRSAAVQGAASLAWGQGDTARAEALYTQALELARDLGDAVGFATALGNLGLVAQSLGDYARARDYLDQAVQSFREQGDNRRIASALLNLGTVHQHLNEPSRAETIFEESLSLSRAVGNQRTSAYCLLNLAGVARDKRDDVRAESLLREALGLLRELEDKRGVASCLNSLGEMAWMRDDERAAAELFGGALVLFQEVGDTPGIAVCLENIAGILPPSVSAAHLFAASSALNRSITDQGEEQDRATQPSAIEALRAALGEQEFAVAWATGRATTLDDAVVDALERTAALSGEKRD
jgi:predicted ATPase/class 3 adenylate cyclase